MFKIGGTIKIKCLKENFKDLKKMKEKITRDKSPGNTCLDKEEEKNNKHKKLNVYSFLSI